MVIKDPGGGQRIVQRAWLYRGMQANGPNGAAPLLGNDSGFQLGVRDNEVEVDILGFVMTESGGMSTSNTAAAVPAFTVSKSYHGGSHNTTNQMSQPFRWKWRIDDANLPADLTARNDHDNHVSIEPAESQSINLAEMRNLVQGTQNHWERLAPP